MKISLVESDARIVARTLWDSRAHVLSCQLDVSQLQPADPSLANHINSSLNIEPPGYVLHYGDLLLEANAEKDLSSLEIRFDPGSAHEHLDGIARDALYKMPAEPPYHFLRLNHAFDENNIATIEGVIRTELDLQLQIAVLSLIPCVSLQWVSAADYLAVAIDKEESRLCALALGNLTVV